MEGDRKRIEYLVNAANWKFSAIAGDIILGDGVKCYATKHFNSKLAEKTVLAMLHQTADALQDLGIKVVRRKVERVIYDDRSSKVGSCKGACPECYLDDLNGQI